MDSETQKIITERTRALPPHVKEALVHVDIPKQLIEISRIHNLRTDQSGTLETEIALTILGLNPTNVFAENITRHVGVSKDIANAIASDVNERIFKAIRLDMAEQQKAAEEQITTPPPALATSPASSESLMATGATAAPSTPENDIVKQKLEGSFRLAPDTVVVKQPTNNPLPTTPKDTYPKGADPYREPIS